MKPDDPNSNWQKLLRRARDDTPPPIDKAALLRAVRVAAATRPVAPGFLEELEALFGSPRTLLTCATLACVGLLFTKWEIANANDSLPWIQLMAEATGGEP